MSLPRKSKSSEADPFSRLTHTVNLWIWISTGFGILITLLALSALFVGWYSIHKQVASNERTIEVLCREINEHNKVEMTIFLQFGFHPHDLIALEPRRCDNIRRKVP